MALESISHIGFGGARLDRLTEPNLHSILRELQSLKITPVAGAGAANTKINIAAIRQEDTIVSVIGLEGGNFVDRTSVTTIANTKATGTITVGTEAAGDTVTVAGTVYTARDTLTGTGNEFLIAALPADTAVNLAAAINYAEDRATNAVRATAATNVVTVTAVADGTAGNALTLAETGSSFTVSGATLAGGTATGGILINADTTGEQLLVFWYNKQ